MADNKPLKRSHIRFPAEPNTLAWVIDDIESDDFRPGKVGLVINEAHKGCSVVTLEGQGFKVGETYRMLVGKLAPINAQLRWVRELEPGIWRLGFEYID